MDPLIACVGGGNMARALVVGSLRAGVMGPGSWLIAEPDPGKRGGFAAMGVHAVASARELSGLLQERTQILLAVKPQALSIAAAEVGAAAVGRVVISILAGTPSTKVL